MKAINNDKVVKGLCGCSCESFNPLVQFAIAGTDITFTSISTLDGDDSLAVLRASVFDKNGEEASNQSTSGSTVVDCSDLDMSMITLKAFVLTSKGCKGDVQLANVTPTPTTSGTLGNVPEEEESSAEESSAA